MECICIRRQGAENRDFGSIQDEVRWNERNMYSLVPVKSFQQTPFQLYTLCQHDPLYLSTDIR